MTNLASPSEQASTTAGERASSAVRAVHLTKVIDDRPILCDINLEIPSGQFTAVLGANGAGKSTLLHILSTLTHASEGELHLFGEPVGRGTPKQRARIGLVGHQSMLYRDLTAYENLRFFGQLYGLKQPGRRAEELLERVGLADRAHDPARAFSRGMVQRLAIARAIVHDPQLLLADEPFAGLDVPSTLALERLLGEFHQSGRTVILINHDIPQSLRLAERVVVLRRGMIALDQPASTLTATVVVEEVSRG